MLEISTANQQDANEITEIFHQVSLLHSEQENREFISPKIEDELEYIYKTLDNPEAVIFKAKEEKIVGYLILYIQTYSQAFFVDEKKGFIGSVGVSETYRGQGIGRQLLQSAEDYLKAHSIFVFDTDVYTFNRQAEKLYDSFGFKNIKYYKRKFLK